jgi:hypothetical protein
MNHMAKSRITEWSQLQDRINSLNSRPRVRAVPRCKINRAPSSPTSNIAIGLTAISAVSAPVFQPALQATSNFLPSSSTALSCEALGTCAQATGFVWPSTSTVVFSSLAFAVGITAATFAFYNNKSSHTQPHPKSPARTRQRRQSAPAGKRKKRKSEVEQLKEATDNFIEAENKRRRQSGSANEVG